jgi:uncharacterized protein (TIGR04255 family)
MDEEGIPQPHDLPNKPLVEAIFELRWAISDSDGGNPPRDPGFRIALGRYYDVVKANYPVVVDLPSAQVPEEMTAYSVRHQFRVKEEQWPLTQIGPGILTVNDTAGYTWADFRRRIGSAVDAIFEAYPAEIHPFIPARVQLRYIDAIPYAPDEMSPVGFIDTALHTEIRADPLMFQGSSGIETAREVRLHLTYSLADPKGEGQLIFASGRHREKGPSIILETIVRSQGENAPSSEEEIKQWVDTAHVVTSRWFFTLCRGQLLRSFEEEQKNAKASL